jgi:uncharacterized protein (TIGR00255 family)
MTGFGKATLVKNSISYDWTIRSVNHRALQIDLQMPSFASPEEIACRKMVEKSFGRGKIECVLKINFSHSQKESVNKKILLSVKKRSNEVQRIFKNAKPMSTFEILETGKSISYGNLIDSRTVKALFKHALERCDKSRQAEGEILERKIFSLTKNLEKSFAYIANNYQLIQKKKYDLAHQKFESLSDEIDSKYIQNYLTSIMQKIDINEEVDRQLMHIDSLQKKIKSRGPIGKEVDFLLQEINREINTISSKLRDKKIINKVINVKLMAERIREQIQNVE